MTFLVDKDFDERTAAVIEELRETLNKHTADGAIDITLIVTSGATARVISGGDINFSFHSSIEDNDEMLDVIDDVLDTIEEKRIAEGLDTDEDPMKRIQ